MGGKKQQAQRSKNNTKPSSSGRSAEHITNIPATPGFSSFKTNQTLKYAGTLPDVIDPSMDPSFQMVFKKMNKKDATTRHKALLEFIALCKASETDIVTNALPSWVRIYSSLVVDVEHRIREAAQHAHRAIVSKVGRNLAPFIKQVAPLWFISQYDTHAPAASAASLAFKEAFPPHKIVDVITFCQNEILQYISENLLSQAPIIYGKTENKQLEEMEAKYARIVVCCLNGYALFLTKIPSDRFDSIKEMNDKIISNANFWKFSKYKAGSVRAAWFSLLSTMCQHAPHFLESEQKRAINSTLIHINDYDPVVLPAAWEASLQIITNFQDCWQHINMEKFLLPKLVNIFSHGGQGNASFICPNVLPLLSRIPDSIINNKQEFYVKIFSSFITGFKQQSVAQSHTESEAIATSFNECIRYIILQHIEELDFCLALTENILKAVATTMVDPLYRHLITSLYTSLTQTLLHWKKNEATNENYKELGEYFWKEMTKLCIDSIDNNIHDKTILNFVYNCQYNLFVILNEPCAKKKKKMKVQFVTDVDSKEVSKRPEAETTTVLNDSNQTEIKRNVSLLIDKLGKKYFNSVLDDTNNDFKLTTIEHLWNISKVLPNDQMEILIQSAGQDISDILTGWLMNHNISTVYLVGFIFNSINFIGTEEKKSSVLAELLKSRPDETLYEAIKMAIYDLSTKPGLSRWLKSDSVKAEVCDVGNITKENSQILEYYLMTNKNGEFILGNDTVSSLFDILTEMLKTGTISLENVNTILNPLFNSRNKKNLEQFSEKILHILELLFWVIVTTKNYNNGQVWLTGVMLFSTLPNMEKPFTDHIYNCAKIVAEYLNELNNEEEVDVNGAVKTSFMLLNAVVQGDKEVMNLKGANICKLFLTTILTESTEKWQSEVENISFTVEFLDGLLPYDEKNLKNGLYIEKGKWDPFCKVNFLSYVWSLLYCLKYLTILMDAQYGEENTDDEQVFEHLHIQLNSEQYSELVQHLLDMCHGLRLCNTIIDNFVNTKQCHQAHSHFIELKPGLKELVQRLQEEQQKALIELCEERCKNGGSLWSRTLKFVKEEFLEISCAEEEIEKTSLDDLTSYSLYLLRKRAECNQTDTEELTSGLELVITTYKNNFLKKQLSELDGSQLCLYSEIVWFLCTIIKHAPQVVNDRAETWDFILISLATWIESINTTQTHEYSKEFVRYVTAVCDLHREFVIHLVEAKNEKVLDEWQEIFASDSYGYVGKIWKHFSEKTLNSNFDHVSLKYLTTLSKMICFICHSNTHKIPCEKFWTDENNVITWLQYGADCITSPYIPVQITCYCIITNIIPTLVKLDSSYDERTLNKLSCQKLLIKLTETHSVVTTLFQDYSFTVSCSVSPCSDSFTYTWGYLLMWSLVLKLCQGGDSQTRYVYTLWIREKELFGHFMESIVRLMPESVLLNINFSKKQELFTTPPALTFDCCTSETLSNFCCWLYCELLRTLPAVVRQWGAEAEPKFLSFIDKLTTMYVSPILCSEEMKAVKEQQKAFENLKVQIFPSAKEVVAVYTVEESAMELVIKLASNHPLSPPKVDIPKGLTASSQTKFIMQLSIFLTHQNGSIWDGLMLWKSNLDKKFDGIEECYICFSILHNTTQQLPKLSCQTCKKKFHSFCLYKWFTTSNKSTCPICRNHF